MIVNEKTRNGRRAYLKIHEEHVALQRDLELPHVLQQPLLLELLGQDHRRQQATQVVRVTLFLREGEPLVVPRIPQQGMPTAQTPKKSTTHGEAIEHQLKILVRLLQNFSVVPRDADGPGSDGLVLGGAVLAVGVLHAAGGHARHRGVGRRRSFP